MPEKNNSSHLSAPLVAGATALVLVAVKLGVGVYAGAMVLIASAVDSGLDFLVSLFNAYAVRGAEKPRDARYNYGRGKLEGLAAFLEDYSFEVITAESAEQALVLCDRHVFGVLIVDLRLPGISGEQLILKANRINPHARFLIHTGSVDFALTEELRRLGMKDQHVLNKPQPGLDIFLETITELIEET